MEKTFFLTINSGNHKPAEKNWLRRTVKAGMVILTIYQVVVNAFISTEYVISTGIIIYGDLPAAQTQLAEIAEIYLRLLENDGFTVRVFPEN